MGLAKTLKDMMLFNEGQNYLGEVKSIKLPVLSRKLEEYRAAGMNGPAKTDHGINALELEATFGGPMLDILRQFGTARVDGVYMRFVGAYQRDDSAPADSYEVIVRGRHEEIDMGDQEVGEAGEFKVKSAIAYYKLVVNGRTEIEIDILRGLEIVGGVDRTAEVRAIIGLN
jgi:P2 family phage contractile tail tube protein